MIGTSAMRVKGAEVQTALYEFNHPDSDSRIRVIGTLHVGSPQYYDTIAANVSETEVGRNAAVHYEEVRSMNAGEVHAQPISARVIQSFDVLRHMSRVLLRAVPGAVSQADALPYQPTWKNTDVSTAELLGMLGTARTAALIAEAQHAGERLEQLSPERLRRLLLAAYKYQPIMRFASQLFESEEAKNARLLDDSVFVDARNERELAAVDDELNKDFNRSVTALWGPEHLPGIREGLEDRGYRLVSRQWLGALSLGGPR